MHDHPISKGEHMKKEKTEKKDPQQATWKDALLEISVELSFGLLSAAIGFGIVSLFPRDMIDDEAMDLFIFIGGFILVAVIALVAFIIHVMKTNRKTKDLQRIYRNLKEKYTVTLMTVTRKKDGKEVNIPIIKGRTSVFKFELSKDAQGFLLSVEYFNKWGDEKYLLVHPQDENEAIDCVEKLISGVSLHEN